MENETDDQKRQEAEAVKLQQGMMLKYRPELGRADRHSSNIPGGKDGSSF